MKNEIHSSQGATASRSCWMLVDDSEEILDLLHAFLKLMTNTSIECFCSPMKALKAFNADPEKYELVLTDYEMPGLNGAEFRRQLHQIAPGVKICLMTGSGYFTDIGARNEGFNALLNKPILPADLRETLTEVFDSKRAFQF